MLRLIVYLIFSNLIFSSEFRFGVDNFMNSNWKEYQNKNIALITNQTGADKNFRSTVDLFKENLNLVKLFSPEHGIGGVIPAGEKVANGSTNSIEVVSLYDKNRKMLPEMLRGVDVLVYDIQDIGCRSYTYISTLRYSMEAANQAGIEFVVLDRPIPYNGDIVDGNILEDGFYSFIGSLNIPYVYGMTPGELAMYIKDSLNLKNLKLKIVEMSGYQRKLDYRQLGVDWIQPSPHIPYPESSLFYTITGILGELDLIWEGVGWTTPFQAVGSPWIDGYKLAKELNGKVDGIKFTPFSCTPFYGDFKGIPVSGVKLYTDENFSEPFYTSLIILTAIQKLYPEKNFLDYDEGRMFEKATGTVEIKRLIKEGKSSDYIYKWYQEELDVWKEERSRFLLYQDN